MLHVITSGIQTTLQGAPRTGLRHFGIPYSGPADALSMALANRLVGNDLEATCLEVTYGGFEAVAEIAGSIAVTGAFDGMTVSGRPANMHKTLHLKAGDHIIIDPVRTGARTYLSVHGGFQAQQHFGSTSTYLPAGFGGLEGRTIKAGDKLGTNGPALVTMQVSTPDTIRSNFTGGFALRACPSPETDMLTSEARDILFQKSFVAGQQATRMGLSLEGHTVKTDGDGMMNSAPVFPGTIQCPPSGTPILLLCDAQTTGGYPRIASVAKCDRHLLGQIRPGDTVRLLERTPDQAVIDYKAKQALLRDWLDSKP